MRAVLFASLLLATATSQADVVAYRCTDATGAVSLQDTPCEQSAQQQRRTLPTPRAPEPRPPTAVVRPLPAGPEPTAPATPDTVPRDPAPLYLCRRYDGQTRESTTGIPERHWVPLWALDADPRAPRTALDPATIGRTSPLRRTARDGVPALQVNALTLGTWVDDVCTQLSPAQICTRRRAALDDYGRRIFNAGQSEGDALRAQERALRMQLAQECG